MLPERSAHPDVALGILVSARRSRSASQSIRARTSTTTVKILRNVYTTQLAIVGPTLTQFKANPFLLDLDLDQKLSSGAPRKRGGLLRISPNCLRSAAAQHLTRDYVRYRGISNYRVLGIVSNQCSGCCHSDSKR